MTRHFESAASSGTTLLYVAGIVIFGFVGLLLLKKASDRSEDAAWELLAKIEAEASDALDQSRAAFRRRGIPFGSPQPPQPAIQRSFAARYEKLADDFIGTGAAPVALYRAATLRFEAANDSRTTREDRTAEMERVIADCERIRRDFQAHSTAPLAYEVLGLACEELGKRDRAMGVYAEALANYPESFLRAKFHYHLGKNYWEQRKMDQSESDLREALGLTLDLEGRLEWRRRAKFLLASIANERLKLKPDGPLKKIPPLKAPEENGEKEAEKAAEDDAPEKAGDAPEKAGDAPEKTGDAPEKEEADPHAGHNHP